MYSLYKLSAFIYFLLFFPLCSFSQAGTIIQLNRVLHDKYFPNYKYYTSTGSKDSIGTIIGGDYSDADAEFTIGLIDMNRNNKYDDFDVDRIIIGPYKADSIFVSPNDNVGKINYYKTCIIQVGTKEYQATINSGGHSIELTKLLGNYLKPDFDFFDRLPAEIFTNIYGDTISFMSFQNKNKYIYVDFWETSNEKTLLVQDSLKDMNNKYKSALTLISLDYSDTDKVKVRNIISRNHFDWEHGFAKLDMIRWSFMQDPLSFRHLHGALFDSNGKLVKLFDEDSPKNLEIVLQEMLNKGK
jgi:hypothetical protein